LSYNPTKRTNNLLDPRIIANAKAKMAHRLKDKVEAFLTSCYQAGMKTLIIALLFASTTTFAAAPCGLNGSVKERIADCKESSGPEFKLVTRTQKGHEIYMGARTGVIWSADLSTQKNFYSDKVSSICSKDQAEFGGLKLKWILPPAERFIQALKYKIQSDLPGVSQRNYWTSNADDFYVNSRYIFEGSRNYRSDSQGNYVFTHLEIEDGYAFVKCIVETI